MLKQKKFSASRKKFAADNVEEILQVKVLNEDGSPADESTLSQEQIAFCAKVASRAYKKFAASKRIQFSADDEVITVVLPESLEGADVEVASDDILADREMNGDPDEVVTEVAEEAEEAEEVVEESQEVVEETEEVIEESQEVAEEVQEVAEEVAENEEVIVNVEEDNEEAEEATSFSAKKFSRNESSNSVTNKVIDDLIGNDGIANYKKQFFAASASKQGRR